MKLAHGEKVVRLRATPTGTDDYGNDIPGEPVEYPMYGVGVAPRTSTERNQGETTVFVGLSLYLPPTPGYNVLPTDRFRVRGVVYEVEGEPGVWRSPFSGTFFGTEVPVRRVT